MFSFLLKQQYLFLQLKMTLEKLSKRSASIRSISLALIFMLSIIYVLSFTSSFHEFFSYFFSETAFLKKIQVGFEELQYLSFGGVPLLFVNFQNK